MTEKVKAYLEYELEGLRRVAAFHPHPEESWLAKDSVKSAALSRALGVALFAQMNGVTYEEVSLLYEAFKNQIEKI